MIAKARGIIAATRPRSSGKLLERMRVAMLLHKSVKFDSRVRREASSLAAAGHHVFVLELAEVSEPVLEGFARRSCLPPARLKRWLPFHLYRIAFLLYFVRGLARVRPDVVHAHDAAMLAPGLFGSWLTGARLIYDSHELATGVPYRERGWGWFVAMLEWIIVPRCDAVITVSDGIAQRLAQRYRLRRAPIVVRNVSALAPQGTDGLRRRMGITEQEPLVLHQGAPAPARGCDVLVDAVALLDGVRLVFLGDPEPGYGAELAAKVRERGIVDRVSILPSVPLDQLLACTAEADVGVTLLQDNCENHRLALPNKLFEYIAAGVPVVASALPETSRLIGDYGIGWVARPDDPAAVAQALTVALAHRDDPELGRRIARAAYELRWPREQQRLLDLYAALVPPRRAPRHARMPR